MFVVLLGGVVEYFFCFGEFFFGQVFYVNVVVVFVWYIMFQILWVVGFGYFSQWYFGVSRCEVRIDGGCCCVGNKLCCGCGQCKDVDLICYYLVFFFMGFVFCDYIVLGCLCL